MLGQRLASLQTLWFPWKQSKALLQLILGHHLRPNFTFLTSSSHPSSSLLCCTTVLYTLTVFFFHSVHVQGPTLVFSLTLSACCWAFFVISLGDTVYRLCKFRVMGLKFFVGRSSSLWLKFFDLAIKSSKIGDLFDLLYFSKFLNWVFWTGC